MENSAEQPRATLRMNTHGWEYEDLPGGGFTIKLIVKDGSKIITLTGRVQFEYKLSKNPKNPQETKNELFLDIRGHQKAGGYLKRFSIPWNEIGDRVRIIGPA